MGELSIFAARVAPEPNWRVNVGMNWPHHWAVKAHYALHYKFQGVDTVTYFKNCKELHFWHKLHEMYRVNKGQETEIITLYMWDVEKGPVEIEDMTPHFQYFRTQAFEDIFTNGINPFNNKPLH